ARNDLDEPAGADAGLERARHGRLDADDAAGRIDRLRGDRDTADETAAADRYDDGVDVGGLVEELERDSAGARDDVRIVVRGDERRAGGHRERLRQALGLVVVRRLSAERRAVTPNRFELGLRRITRSEDDEALTERLRRGCQRAAVIAGRRRDQRQGPATR